MILFVIHKCLTVFSYNSRHGLPPPLPMYYVLHHCKGSPFSRHDQGKFRRYTYWEQIDKDSEVFFSPTKNFFIGFWGLGNEASHVLETLA